MKRAQILTPWIGAGSGTSDPRRPALADDYSLKSWADVTGQPVGSLPPSPNLYAIEVLCQDSVMTAIEADANYSDGILWSEDA